MNINLILLHYIVSAVCLNAKQEITEQVIIDCCDFVVAAITICCLGFSNKIFIYIYILPILFNRISNIRQNLTNILCSQSARN